MTSKILTVYCHGSYGTYLSWAVSTYSNLNTSNNIVKPFAYSGSAHLYRQVKNKPVVPHHKLINDVSRVIFIKPRLMLDYFNNHYSKHHKDNQLDSLADLLLDIAKFNQASVWEKRETLSYFLPSLFESWQETYKKIEYDLTVSDSMWILIDAEDILYNHIQTLDRIFAKFGLTKITSNEVIAGIHQEYMSLQKHLNKVEIVNQIVDCCLTGKFLEIKELTLFDEAYIQHLLRTKNIELSYRGVDKFPENTEELSKILDYPSN